MGITSVSLASHLAARLTGIRDEEPVQRHTRHHAPIRTADFRTPVSVMGSHGGAGASTVARLLGAPDIGRRWPDPDAGFPPGVLLVARTHAAGLMAVSQALAGYSATSGHQNGPFLTGVVMVPDAPGRLPKSLRRRITILASAALVHRLPWAPSWRLTETAYDEAIAADLRRFAERAATAVIPAMHEHEGETCD